MAKRRRVRLDRVMGAGILLVAMIFLLGSCMQRCSDDDTQPPSTADSNSTAEQTQNTQNTAPADGSQTTAVTTPVSSNANVPVVITDAPATSSTPPAEADTSEEESSSTESVYMLPAGYQEIPVSQETMHQGNLILVNNELPCRISQDDLELEQVYYASDKPETYEVSYPGHTSLNRTALTQFNRLMKAYFGATSNKEIMFNYGYLEAGKEKSNPDSPTALDIQLHIKRNDGGYEYISNVSPYSWLFEHMASYGFILRYPPDKSELTGERGSYTAIRYVGVPHAAYMNDNDLCLEEYLEQLKTMHNFYTGTLLEYSTTELTYHIYYVPARSEGGDMVIPVPTSASYEISGNNSDGFIVTAIIR